MVDWSAAAHKAVDYTPHPAGGNGKAAETKVAAPVEYISAQQLHVAFYKLTLADEQDVDGYLAALKAALLDAVRAGKHVNIA